MANIVAASKLFRRNLKRGMEGDDVWAAKQRLFALGMYSTKIKELKSHALGVDSIDAIRRFQIANGLQVDGIIGKQTWGALFDIEVSDPFVPDAPEDLTYVKLMLNLAQAEVDNGSCYVWGASGELGVNATEKWIRAKEARNNGGANADRAVERWTTRLESGNTKFRLFDCSGYVSWVLTKAGVFSGRRDCDGLWSLSKQIDEPKNGALLFRVNSENYEDETHVGLYFNGYQYHAKGRNDGVTKERYSTKYWHKMAWWKAL